jgi:hypothetical protein
MTDQKTAPAEAAKESKGDKFKRLASGRVTKALEAISQLRALANKAQYEFTAEQAEKIFTTLGGEVDSVAELYKAALEGKAAPTKAGFSL